LGLEAARGSVRCLSPSAARMSHSDTVTRVSKRAARWRPVGPSAAGGTKAMASRAMAIPHRATFRWTSATSVQACRASSASATRRATSVSPVLAAPDERSPCSAG